MIRRGTPARRRFRADAVAALATLLLLTGGGGPEAPVADAAMREDVTEVRALLKRGADVNAAQGDGMTALHWAAQHGNLDLTEMLLYAGANPSATTRIGPYTPLMVAARGGYGGVVERLLEAGASVDAATSTGVTSLHLAAAAGSEEAVSALLNRGAAVDATEAAWEQTPLMWAADNGRTGAIELLLLAGADVSAREKVVVVADLEAEDAVESRARRERMAEIRAQRLAEATANGETWVDSAAVAPPPPADEEPDEPPAEVEPDRDARAPVAEAPADDEEDEDGDGAEEEEAPRPLSYGDLVGGHGGLSAFHHAIREGHTEAALALLDAGADIDAPTGGDGTPPLVLATINGHFDLGLELLARGADVNKASDAGVTALFAAVNVQWAPKALYPQPRAYEQQTVSYLDYMERLLEAGADPNARVSKHIWFMSYNFDLLGVDMDGATAFWRAAYATDVAAMRLLVANGADPGIPTRKPAERRRRGGSDSDEDKSGLDPIPVGGPGVYPIHAASGVGYGKDFAANSHRHVPDGWLPTVRYLVEELGADVNARDHEGYSPVHHAAARGDNELILYLVEKGADVTLLARNGQTTADMANGPVQRVQPFPETVALLESLGSANNDRCLSC